MIKRFRDEAMSASRLNHPNCVSIIDYGQAPDGLLYLAMEYVKGPTLTQLLVNENPLAVDRVIDIMVQSLAGIEEAHLAGVVHADLKADNIILDQRRAGIDVVKIVDFGIARLVTGVRETEDRSISGTPEYMAPEVISGAPPSFAIGHLRGRHHPLRAARRARRRSSPARRPRSSTNHLKAHDPARSRRAASRCPEGARRGSSRRRSPSIRPIGSRRAAEMREALMAIRARMRRLPDADKCAACGAVVRAELQVLPRVRRAARARLEDVRDPGAADRAATTCLPLPFTGRAASSQHAARAHAQGAGHGRRPARDRARGRGPQRTAPPGVRAARRRGRA